jgi:hypothetical protein
VNVAEIRIQHKERHAWPWIVAAIILALIAFVVLTHREPRPVGRLDSGLRPSAWAAHVAPLRTSAAPAA